MGDFQHETTHVSRSSSKSYALRWKQKNLRHIVILTVISIILLNVTLFWYLTQQNKSIFLVVDGQTQTLETNKSELHQLLGEHSIVLDPKDTISAPLSSKLKDGDRVVINRAVKVNVTVDGTTNEYLTSGAVDTVNNVITELGIAVSEADKIYPSPTSPVTANMNIRVVRVTKQVVKTSETVPYAVVNQKDTNLLKGKTKVVQEGVPGVIEHHIEKVFQDGKFAYKREMKETVVQPAKEQIVAVGSKVETLKETSVLSASIARDDQAVSISEDNSTTQGGVSFNYKKVLKNVSLTAYSAEQDGIGTKTASGTTVKHGRTIAVDTDVIPMGWWVYIEGVGFRRAEDTGGAVNGNKIDVYFDTLKEAKQFGRKKGRTVYVIGPKMPELN